MASGIEVAGLVLAVIPLITKAAESCRQGGRIMSLLRSRGHNELRRRLSEGLYIELVLFHNHLKHLIQGLPDLSEARCNAVLTSFDQRDWKSDSDIVQALQSHLGQPDFDHFAHAIDNVYQWMNDVLQDESFRSQFGVQGDQNYYLRNLNVFTQSATMRKAENAFTQRFRLYWNQGKLEEQIRRVKKWRKFVEKITEKNQNRPQSNTNVADDNLPLGGRPSCMVPRLSRALYDVLSEKWKCRAGLCQNEAKICLQIDHELHRKTLTEPTNISYKLLISIPHAPAAQIPLWKECAATITARPKRTQVKFRAANSTKHAVHADCLTPIKDVCTVLQAHRSSRARGVLSFAADHFEDDASTVMYRDKDDWLDPASRFPFEASSKSETLADVLTTVCQQLDLTKKRSLALMLAYGLMTFSDSWMSERWSKTDISFFRTRSNDLCYMQPFLTSNMKHRPDKTTLPQDVVHPLPGLLSLGILLLELETAERIEDLRTDDDYMDPILRIIDSNTDFTAALKAAESRSMSSPRYKEAILACLSTRDWGRDADLDHDHVRRRIYDQVLHKLETDLQDLTA